MWAAMSNKVFSCIFTRFGAIFVTVAVAFVLQFVTRFFHKNKKNVSKLSNTSHFLCSRVAGTVLL